MAFYGLFSLWNNFPSASEPPVPELLPPIPPIGTQRGIYTVQSVESEWDWMISTSLHYSLLVNSGSSSDGRTTHSSNIAHAEYQFRSSSTFNVHFSLELV